MTAPHATAEGPGPIASRLSALSCVTVLIATVLLSWTSTPPPEALSTVPTSATSVAVPWFEVDAPAPVRVRSDAVDIEATTIPLGTREDGGLEVPDDAYTAGWFTGRSSPGERGPAVIVGHVDSRQGPGAFWELPDLESGDRVSVEREDGTSVHWRVDRVEQHPKDDFPTDEVYGWTEAPTLRLVTCSGAFDRAARRYVDNTIVFLVLDDTQDFEPTRLAPTGVVGHTVAPEARPLGSSGSRPGGVAARPTDPTSGGDRRVPILLAALSVLGSSGLLAREWSVRG
ncbi:MAG: class F sortase [Nitriliruptor sp.]|uniref:class F sortase n=1 Tax=Nitriliruptor sp. TaxID=2448056 RepID=UPI0034A03CC5